MTGFQLQIGLNDRNTLKQEIQVNKAIELIANVVGDCTIKTGNIGIYTMDNGQHVIENSLEVTTYTLDREQATAACQQLCKLLNQESIALTEVNTVAEFIRV